MSKNTVATNLREIAMRMTDEDVARSILKAAANCDELRIDCEVAERLLAQMQRWAASMPRHFETLGVEIVGLREDLKRYERTVKELQQALAAEPKPTDGLAPFELDENGMLKRNS